MSISTYLPGDPRLEINSQVASTCLDGIKEIFKENKLPSDSYSIIMLAISISTEKSFWIPDLNCLEKFKNSGKEKRQILDYVRLSDKQLAFLYAETIEKEGIENGIDFHQASKLWATWAEEGLKILYCRYFKDYNVSNDIYEILDEIFDIRPNSTDNNFAELD